MLPYLLSQLRENKAMNRIFVIILLTTAIALVIPGISCKLQTAGQKVTFEQLISDPNRYNGKEVVLETFYFHGFEIIVLSKSLKESVYKEGHLVPAGALIWVEGGIPLEVYNNLQQQHQMGPTERYGKMKIKGKFQFGGKYGHLGGYQYQITPSEVELLP